MTLAHFVVWARDSSIIPKAPGRRLTNSNYITGLEREVGGGAENTDASQRIGRNLDGSFALSAGISDYKQGIRLRRSKTMKIVMLCITLLIFAAGAISVVADKVTGNPAQLSNHQSRDGVRRITPEEVRQVLKDGKAILVDVRNETAYRAGHIKGAILIPVDEIGGRVAELPKDKLIVTYCAWPAEQTSAGAVQTLNEKGIKNAAAVLGGYQALLKAGFEEETGN
jgi:rhodanese-related sulfurtransferase